MMNSKHDMTKRAILGVAIAATAALPALATELATDVLHDKDVILHLPLDGDFLSISNAVANPSAIQTNKASGGSVTFMPCETEGQFVVDSMGAGRGRDNGGYLHIAKSQVLLDLTEFGIGYGVTNITVEGYIRGKYPDGMASWGCVLGMGAWTNNNGKVDYNNRYHVLVSPNETTNQIYLRADGFLSDGNQYGTIKSVENGLNGEWHHFAMVITPLKADWAPEGLRTSCYLDHEYVGAMEGKNRWHGFSDMGDGRRLYLLIGNKSSTVDFDEIRIIKGTLRQHEFLRLRTREPADGEEVLHLTFDDQNLKSTVFTNDQPVLVSGTSPTGYSTDVPGPFISDGRHSSVKRTNTHSLHMDAKMMRMYMTNWLLGENGMKDLTLEFFIKGEAGIRTFNWAGPFGLANPNDKFPFLVQVENNGYYYLRADLPYWNGTGSESGYINLIRAPKVSYNDGKWHHIALTVKGKENDTSRVEVFFDHVSQGVVDSPNHAWKGLTNKGYMRFGYLNAGHVWIDEVRITKGVLTTDKMMYRRLGGCTVIFR